ncbi:hypothetical protein RFI_23002, partial [Reticulomyxa filosa]
MNFIHVPKTNSGRDLIPSKENIEKDVTEDEDEDEDDDDDEDSFVPTPGASVTKEPIIVDWGSYQIKLGTRKDKTPLLSVESAMTYAKGSKGENESSNISVGAPALRMYRENPNETKLQTPLINKGSKFDWECVDALTDALLWEGLELESSEHPVFITHRHMCSEISPASSRELNHGKWDWPSAMKFVEMYFETYHNPKVYITTSNLLSLYGSGLTNGLVVESGHHGCTITPIQENGVITYEHIFGNHDYYGGHDVTKFFFKYLKNDHIEQQQLIAERSNSGNPKESGNTNMNSNANVNAKKNSMKSNSVNSTLETGTISPYSILQSHNMYDRTAVECLKHKASFVVHDYTQVEQYKTDIQNQ